MGIRIGIGSLKIGQGSTGVDWSSYWTQQYQDVYDAFTTKPDTAHRLSDARMVKFLVDNGIWNKLDVFQFYGTHTNDNGEALINWIDTTKFNPELKGTVLPSFSANNGFTGNSAQSAYIDTNYNPSSLGNKYTQNSACYGYETRRQVSDAENNLIQTSVRNYLILNGMGSIYANINQSTAGAAILQPNYSGLYIVSRTASNLYKVYRDGIELGEGTDNSTGVPDGNLYLFARNSSGTPGNFSNTQITCFFAGEGLSKEDCQLISSAILTRTFYATKSYNNHLTLMPSPVMWGQHSFESFNGKLYAMGGITGIKNYEYDPLTNWWEEKSDLPHGGAHVQSAALRTANGKLYFIGGLNSSTGTHYQNVYEYNPETDTYTAKTNMPTGREDFGSAVIGNKIYCFGGIASGGRTKVMEVYDTETDTWDETKADLPVYKQLGDFGCTCNGKIYAIGASDQVYLGGGVQEVLPVVSGYAYDPDTDEWTAIANIPVGTVYNERAVIGNYIYVVGGVPAGLSDELATYIKDIYRYDTVNNVWAKIVDAPYALHGASLAEYNGSIYMLGGGRNSIRTSDTKEFYKLVV